MANTSDMNFFEKHVEKLVLAVFVLLLAYVLVAWGFSSPRTLTVAGNDSYPPTKVDPALKKLSVEVQSKMEAATRPVEPLRPYLDIMKEYRNAGGVQKYVAMDYGTPAFQVARGGPSNTIIPTSLAALTTSLPSSNKPVVWADREVSQLNKDQAQERPTAHVATVFSRAELAKQWNKPLSDANVPLHVVVLEVKGEDQELLPNGAWGEPMPVKTYMAPLPADQKVPALPPPGGDMSKIFGPLGKLQEGILQPPAPKIWIPGSGWVDWQVHLPRTEVADISASVEPAAVEPSSTTPVVAPTPGTVPPVREPRMGPRRPGEMIGPGYYGPGERPPMGPGQYPPGPGVGPGPSPASPTAPATLVTAGLPVVPTPPFARQVEEGKVLVYYHTDAIQGGKTYRFRVQLVVINPLASLTPDTRKEDAKKVVDIKDTKVATITLPPSEWSDKVSIPNVTQFFVTNGSESVKEVTVMVFSQCLGQRVHKSYTVKVGQMIGRFESVDVINPIGDKTIKAPADFSTGATATAFDFNKRASGEDHVVEMVYLDDQCCLKSRLSSLDKACDLHKQLAKEAKETDDRLKAARHQ